MVDVSGMVDRLADIRRQQEGLKAEAAALEGELLKLAEADLKDTKNKTVVYTGFDSARVVATMAKSLKPVYPSYYRTIFGDAYKDAVTEETKYKLSAPAAKMLTGLWSGGYTRTTVEDVVAQIPGCDDKARAVLLKKLHGINYENDRRNLMNIAGLDEDTAGEYAYFVAEAAVWESYQRLLQVSGMEADTETILNIIQGAVVVEYTPKITVEYS